MTKEEAIKYIENVLNGRKDKRGKTKIDIALETAIKALEQEQKWIPVSERLPESDDDVLVTNGKGMYIGWIDPTDKRWRVDSESEYYMENVVAWMPLPKTYKAESEDKE